MAQDVYIKPGDDLVVTPVSGSFTIGKGRGTFRVFTREPLVFQCQSTFERMRDQAHLAHAEKQEGCSLCYGHLYDPPIKAED